jgi:hypothetical protein
MDFNAYCFTRCQQEVGQGTAQRALKRNDKRIITIAKPYNNDETFGAAQFSEISESLRNLGELSYVSRASSVYAKLLRRCFDEHFHTDTLHLVCWPASCDEDLRKIVFSIAQGD